MFLLVPNNCLSAFKCKQKLKAKTERNTKKSGYHLILIKINILCKQKCELFKDVFMDLKNRKRKNCIPSGKYIPLFLNEKYHKLIRLFEENTL